MAIVTFGAVSKGSDSTFTLSKAELVADPLVAADPYFSDQGNWSEVVITYKTTIGGQLENIFFDASLGTPTGTFSITAGARDDWEVQSLVIYDHDDGRFTLDRLELTVVDFDLTATSAPEASKLLVTSDFVQPWSVSAPLTTINTVDVAVYDQTDTQFDIGGGVEWRVRTTGGTYGVEVIGTTSVTSFNSGFARFDNIQYASDLGSVTLEFYIPSRPELGVATSYTVNVTSVPEMAGVRYKVHPEGAAAPNIPLPTSPVVQLVDQFGADWAQAGINIILKSTFAPNEFTDLVGNTQITTLADGSATFTNVYFDKELDGPLSSFISGSYLSAATTDFWLKCRTASVLSTLEFSPQPTGAAVNTFLPTFNILLKDQYGAEYVTTGNEFNDQQGGAANGYVYIDLLDGAGNHNGNNSKQLNLINGTVTFPDFAIDTAGSYRLQVRVNNTSWYLVTQVQSSSITITT